MTTINGISFNMHSYYLLEDGVSLKLTDTDIRSIEAAVGEGATVKIGTEYKGYDLVLGSVIKDYDDKGYRVNMHSKTLEQMVAQNTEDIETNSQAIIELAELIG